jgi:ubiquinone biosynthesis protein UbiJ
MLEIFAVPATNRLLRSNPWALDALRPHAGKTVRVICPPVVLQLTVLASGELSRAADGSEPATTISLTPGVLMRVAARDPAAWSAARVTGDVELAAAIDRVRRDLEWDYEEDLSRVLGDVAAHRVGDALRRFDRWGRSSALNFAQAAVEYATYEQPLLASARAVDEFNREVDVLRDDAARLAKRLSLLERRAAGDSE